MRHKINIDRWLDLNSKKLLFTYNKAKDQPNRNEIVKKQENEIWRLEIILQIGFNVFIRTKFKTNGKLKFMWRRFTTEIQVMATSKNHLEIKIGI